MVRCALRLASLTGVSHAGEPNAARSTSLATFLFLPLPPSLRLPLHLPLHLPRHLPLPLPLSQIRLQLAETATRLKLGAPHELEMAATLTNGGGGGDVVGGGGDAVSGTAVCRIDADLGRQVRRCLTTAFFMQAAERQPSGASSLLKAPL